MHISAIAFLFLGWLSLCCGLPMPYQEAPKLILISMDGFRHDYLEIVGEGVAPNFYKLMNAGVRSSWVKNSYLTITMPNHFSIITGLYDESHNVVDNHMYDPILKEIYDEDSDDGNLEKNTRFFENAGFPIWLVNMINSKPQQQRGSAVLGWPGTPVRIRGVLPDVYFTWNESLPWLSRVDRCVQLLANASANINFVELYFEEPDATGHSYGPLSPQVRDVIGRLDATLGYLMYSLEAYGLKDQVNIIITADHGMTTIYRENYIDLSRYTNASLISDFSAYMYNAINNSLTKVYTDLQKAKPYLTVYLKDNVPEKYHYRRSNRLQDMIFMPQDGYYVVFNNKSLPSKQTWGTHGFSNDFMDMWPFFVAYGPAFKKGYWAAPIENVDIYPLMCHILHVAPFPNNGSFARVADMLAPATQVADAIASRLVEPPPPSDDVVSHVRLFIQRREIILVRQPVSVDLFWLVVCLVAVFVLLHNCSYRPRKVSAFSSEKAALTARVRKV